MRTVPELLIVLMLVAVRWLLPLAAGVWALVTLFRIRSAQEQMGRKLDAVERLLQGGRSA